MVTCRLLDAVFEPSRQAVIARTWKLQEGNTASQCANVFEDWRVTWKSQLPSSWLKKERERGRVFVIPCIEENLQLRPWLRSERLQTISCFQSLSDVPPKGCWIIGAGKPHRLCSSPGRLFTITAREMRNESSASRPQCCQRHSVENRGQSRCRARCKQWRLPSRTLLLLFLRRCIVQTSVL